MADVPLLEITDLHVVDSGVDGRQDLAVVDGVSLAINPGRHHVLLGPTEPSMSALAAAIHGSPRYRITAGSVRFQGDDITAWPPDVRAKAGMFLADPRSAVQADIPMLGLLRRANQARGIDGAGVSDLNRLVGTWAGRLGLDDAKTSGVNRWLAELVQMAILEPKLVSLDRFCEGLTTSEAAVVAGLETILAEYPMLGTLTISTTARFLLDQVAPRTIHVMAEGRIITSGGPELANKIATDGYESFL